MIVMASHDTAVLTAGYAASSLAPVIYIPTVQHLAFLASVALFLFLLVSTFFCREIRPSQNKAAEARNAKYLTVGM